MIGWFRVLSFHPARWPVVPLVAALLLLPAQQVSSGPGPHVAWVHQFNPSVGNAAATAIAIDPDGNLLVAGWTEGALGGQTAIGQRDAFVSKLDPSGHEVWTRQFGTRANDLALAVAAGADRSVFVSGQTGGSLAGTTPAGPFDAFVRRYGTGGEDGWVRQFGGTGASAEAAATTLTVDDAGNLLVGGWIRSPNGQSGAVGFVRQYAADGADRWMRSGLASGNAGHPTRIAAHGGNDLVVVAAPQVKRTDLSVISIDNASGQVAKTQLLDTADPEELSSLAVDSHGLIYAIGLTDDDHGHPIARQYDTDGSQLWTQLLHVADPKGVLDLVTADIAVDATGNVYALGNSPAGAPGVYVRRYDNGGRVIWTERLASSATDTASSLALGPNGAVFVAGSTQGSFPGQPSASGSSAFVGRIDQ
jgi:hypothetical protein